MSEMAKVRIILTGIPGVGKTTLEMYIAEQIQARGNPIAGFTTLEVRNGGTGKREGFDIVTLGSNSQRVPLARSNNPGRATGPKVGQYEVNLADFEKVAVATLENERVKDIDFLVIDEIGKMECLSRRFQTLARQVFSSESTRVVIATGGFSKNKPLPLVEELSNMPDTKLVNVTKANRDSLKNELLEIIFPQNT